VRHEHFLVTAIGYVENDHPVLAAPELSRAAVSRIVLDPALVRGVHGLEPRSQILVVFFSRRSGAYSLLQHPRGDRSLPRYGVFALRSLDRPNPIGVSIVDLQAVEGNVLIVRGLDASHGTPVLDIRPALSYVIDAARLLVRAQARAVARLNSATTAAGVSDTAQADDPWSAKSRARQEETQEPLRRSSSRT
jgi:tRNA-Thr(GGU) m(6)t(6)A37 methyltransferase TsaA